MLRPAVRADLSAIVGVYAAWDLANRGFVDGDSSDVTRDWNVPGFDLATRTRVLEEDGQVVGYAVAAATGDVDSVTTPGAGGDDDLLGWLESLGEPLRHHLPTDDADGTARMQRRGWVADRTSWRMRIELDGHQPAPTPLATEPLDPERHGHEVHRLIQRAFADIGDDHVEEDFGTWAAAALAPERFDPELCRLVVEDGTVVAAIITHRAEGFGFVPQLAVTESHRRRGLGEALLRDAFDRCAAIGLPAVELAVDSANATGATRLYERVGMHATESFTRWRWDPPV